MTKTLLLLTYIFLTIAPLFVAIVTTQLIDNRFLPNFETLIASGLSGSIILGIVLLKRWHDRKVILTAIKADLECFSSYLTRCSDSLNENNNGLDGIVNISVANKTKNFLNFVEKIGLLEIEAVKSVIEAYDTIETLVPSLCLLDGVEKINEHQLRIPNHSRKGFNDSIVAVRDIVNSATQKLS